MIDNIDKAIINAREVASKKRKQAEEYSDKPYDFNSAVRKTCLEWAEEQEHLAEWLTELKQRREAESTSDLISRSVLDEIRQLYKDYQPNLATKVIEFGNALERLIDNAPPVEAYTLEDMQNNYDAGVDSVIGKYDKAQGEWQGGELGHCTKCGHKGSASDIWSGCDGMFCPNCGANLKGGDDK